MSVLLTDGDMGAKDKQFGVVIFPVCSSDSPPPPPSFNCIFPLLWSDSKSDSVSVQESEMHVTKHKGEHTIA